MLTKESILIVEDEPAIAQDIEDILLLNGYNSLGIAFSYDKAIEMLARKTPDLVFLDIALKGNGTGLDVAQVINEKYKIPFIFLTSFSDQETINDVVNLNPQGYLVKPFKERDIAPAVALALVNAKNALKEVFPSIEIINKKTDKALSSQEFNVLKLIWEGKKNNDIANDLFVSINTIKTHIGNLYQKLEVNSRAAAINKVMNL